VSGTLVGSGPIIAETLVATTVNPGTAVYTITPARSGCPGTPIMVTVTVNPIPDVVATPPSQTICSGATTAIALSTSNGVTAGTTYSWTVSQTGVSGATSGFGTAINQPLSTTGFISGTAIYTITPSNGGCNGTPIMVTITVNPLPNVVATPSAQTICSNTATSIGLSTTNGVAGATYSWTVTQSGVTGATASSGTSINQVLNAIGSVSGTATYTITPAVGSCSGTPLNYTVTVLPKPTAAASNIIICSGQNAVISISPAPANVTGTTFSWTITADPNVLGATNDNGSLINQNLTLTNSTVGNVTYHITPSANGCSGVITNVTVTVNPVATVDAGVDYQVCEPTVIPLSGTIGGAAASGTWTIVSGLGSLSANTTVGTVVTANYTVNPSDITTTIVLRLQTNDPDAGGPCSFVSDVLNIQINRKPTVTTPIDYVVCEPSVFASSPIMLTGTIGGSATTGLWSVITGTGGLSATNVSGVTVTANYVIAPADVNTTLTFRLTTNDPDGLGPCTAVYKDINIHVNPRAVVSAGPDLKLCRNFPSIALQGSYSGAPSVLWTGGTGSYSSAANPVANYTFNDPSEVNTTFTLTLTTADPDGAGPCAAVSDQMTLTIYPLPTVNFFGLPSTVAENIAPFPINGTQAGGLFTISPATSNIGSTSAIPGPTDVASFDPSAVTLGFNSVTYTYTDGNGCRNATSKSIVVNPVTVIDFALQYACPGPAACPFVPVNGSGEFEICSRVGKIKLVGNPAAPGGGANTGFVGTGTNGAIVQAAISTQVNGGPGPDYYLDTDLLPSDTYLIQYNYRNSSGDLSSPVTRAIKVFASPTASIQTPANNCITSLIALNDNSTMSTPNPYSGSITAWVWNFGDGTSGSGANTTHDYNPAGPGIYNVTLDVTTFQGCKDKATLSLRVGPRPLVDFNWSAICTNDLTRYADKTNAGISVITDYTWDFGDGDILTGPAGGNVPGGTHGGRTTGTLKDPKHNYLSTGTYPSKLTVNTNDGCTNSITQSVFILTAGVTVTPFPGSALAYKEDFDDGVGGNWIAEGLRTSPLLAPPVFSPISWIFGTPSGATIKTAASGSTAWWTGKNIAINGQPTYFDDETSVVNGPCFDLTNLKRPMIALDYWSDSEKNLDGTVLQYSTDGGINWQLVGPLTGLSGAQRDQGINWYDPNATIVSNPGQQLIGQYGWTDKSAGWKNGRFNLDMVNPAQRAQVRIRIAFSSNNQNASGQTFDGFAFDNVYVGDKQRNVLVEHFTNSTLNGSVAGDTWINNLYQNQITSRGTSDFNDIQYHISFPNTDQLNVDNPSDPAARALYFGVSQPPATIMDGILNSKFTGKYTDLDLLGVEVDRRALVDPLFDLQLENVATSDNNKISVKVTINALKNFNSPLILQTALIENQVGTFKNVLRKQLFGADGETITLPFTAGNTLVKTKDNVVINVPIADNTNTSLIAYIQDKNTKEIYQSVVIPILAPFKVGSVVVGLEKGSAPTTLSQISVYPNPASGHFNLKVPDDATVDGFTWKLIDQRGKTISNGDFNGMQDNTKQVDITGVANGIYFIMLSAPDQSVAYQKVVVLNRN
ncbi:MAG: PKD domain-containing protein, partial [Cyclobacteriaceae bacterium]|nr:PKD domain-containing protein [Cyclobacteriaceae bacterium]